MMLQDRDASNWHGQIVQWLTVGSARATGMQGLLTWEELPAG